MEKIKEIQSWVGVDGFFHLLVCWLVVLVVTPIGVWLAVVAAAILFH